MSEPFRSIRFHCNFQGQRVEGPVVNPGDWYGKVWLIEIPNGPLLAVEADNEDCAIDVLSDSSEYGHWINISEEQAQERERGGHEREYAGNNSQPVDTTMVRVWPKTLGLTYTASWAPLFWQKSQMLDSAIKDHDKECVI